MNNCIEKNRRICMRITWKENELKRKHIMYSVQRTHTVSGASLKCMPWQLWNCSLYCLLLIKLNRVQFFFLSFISKCNENDFLCLRQVRTRLSLRECFSLFLALLLFAAPTSLYFFCLIWVQFGLTFTFISDGSA